MLYGVRMSGAVVRVCDDMLMCVIVLLDERINYDDYSSQNHYAKTDKICPKRFFIKNNERQQCTYKRCYRIVRACFRGSDNALRLDIEEYAQTVCNEA